MKALVVNTLGHGFELEDIDITAPMGREVLIDVEFIFFISTLEPPVQPR
jgi:Zn-dependent alcohol dehydrogenase